MSLRIQGVTKVVDHVRRATRNVSGQGRFREVRALR